MYRFAAVLIFLFAPSCTGIIQPLEGPPAEEVVPEPAAPVCVPLQGTITTLARGLYCVTGDVIIPTGVTLDIPAGTTFIFKGRYHFGRDPELPDFEPPLIAGSGSLRAIGTAAEPIIFRGETKETGWYGIVISHAHDPVQFEYVTISDTYKDDRNPNSRIWRRGGALNSYLNAKGTIIRHSTFTNNRAFTVAGAVEIYGHGQWPNEAPVEITDSTFENNSCECGTYYASSADLCSGGAVRLSLISGDADLVKIRGNLFRGNEARRTGTIDSFGGAIGGSQTGVILGPGNVFDSNRGGTGDGAISCNHKPTLGSNFAGVDPSVTFSANLPDNGCGK